MQKITFYHPTSCQWRIKSTSGDYDYEKFTVDFLPPEESRRLSTSHLSTNLLTIDYCPMSYFHGVMGKRERY